MPVTLRSAETSDRESILVLVADAFAHNDSRGGVEVELVRRVWSLDACVPELELVALHDGAIVGHILGSVGALAGEPALAVAPLSVAVRHQGEGIGSALMTEFLERAEAQGWPLVLLLGNPRYYQRFGFVAGGELGIAYAPVGPDSPYFQARCLSAFSAELRGDFSYCWEIGTSPAQLQSARNQLLARLRAALASDSRVLGLGLVGSCGRGTSDEWSDLDLLAVVADDAIDEVAPWSDAAVLVDARRNVPVGARSTGTLYLEQGLPIGVDWYLYPQSQAAWPVDSLVLDGANACQPTDESFADWNADGPRNEPITSDREAERARVLMIPVIAKHLARRSPELDQLLLLALGPAQPTDGDPAVLLRRTVEECVEQPAVSKALHRLLDLADREGIVR